MSYVFFFIIIGQAAATDTFLTHPDKHGITVVLHYIFSPFTKTKNGNEKKLQSANLAKPSR